ncbi:MAG: hypothetical protein HYZ15_10205 [Sphingobacteriales bacterium]|nr:hypothetical protein [Sphingobacteriales bacterium]
MRWEPVSSTPDQEVYHLYKDDKKILSLTLHPFSQSARVETESEKRVFQIRKEGFLRNKTVLRSEYGIKIGELGHENGQHFIDINEERYFYAIKDNPLAELLIYKEQKELPLITCGLSTEKGSPEILFKKGHTLANTSQPGLLMALCWYMFLPVTRETLVDLAQ